MQDVVLSAKANGVNLTPDLPEKMMGNSETMGPYRTSMQIDYEVGRALEVEAIIGEPLRRALAGGITPLHLRDLYHQMQRLGASVPC